MLLLLNKRRNGTEWTDWRQVYAEFWAGCLEGPDYNGAPLCSAGPAVGTRDGTNASAFTLFPSHVQRGFLMRQGGSHPLSTAPPWTSATKPSWLMFLTLAPNCCSQPLDLTLCLFLSQICAQPWDGLLFFLTSELLTPEAHPGLAAKGFPRIQQESIKLGEVTVRPEAFLGVGHSPVWKQQLTNFNKRDKDHTRVGGYSIVSQSVVLWVRITRGIS